MSAKKTEKKILKRALVQELSQILSDSGKPKKVTSKKINRQTGISQRQVPLKVKVSLGNPYARENICPLLKISPGTTSIDLDSSMVSKLEKLIRRSGTPEKTLSALQSNLETLLGEWSEPEVAPALLNALAIESRGYLRETVEGILGWLKKRSSGTRAVCNIVWATGLGKSYLALLLAALMPEAKQVLVVTSSQILVNQHARLFKALGRSVSHVSCAAVPAEVELSPFGQIVLMTNRGAALEDSSTPSAAESGKVTQLSKLVRPDLLIVDEMDTTYTIDQWEQVEAWMNQGCVVIAMSATRDHLVKANNYSGPSLDKIFVGGLEYVLVRLGRDFYGPTIIDFGLAYGIDHKLLSMPKYFQWVLPMGLSVLSDTEADDDFSRVCAFVFSQMNRPEYRKWLIEKDGSWKAMMFTTRTIERSLFLVEAAHDADIGFSIEAVTSETSPIEREASIARIERGEVNAIVGPNALSRGLNVPKLKVLIRLNPRSSMHTSIQEIGRINRSLLLTQSVRATPASSIVIIDVITPDWSRYITAPEALRFCGLSGAALQELMDGSPWFEDVRRSPNSLRPKISGIWGDTLHRVYGWFVMNFPQYSGLLKESEFEKVLYYQYIKDPSRIGSGLEFSESDKACVHTCITDIVHMFELEDDSEWLSVENVISSGAVTTVPADMVERLDEIVDEWIEKYQLEEYNLRHQFPLQLSNTSNSAVYYHVDVWNEELIRDQVSDPNEYSQRVTSRSPEATLNL